MVVGPQRPLSPSCSVLHNHAGLLVLAFLAVFCVFPFIIVINPSDYAVTLFKDDINGLGELIPLGKFVGCRCFVVTIISA